MPGSAWRSWPRRSAWSPSIPFTRRVCGSTRPPAALQPNSGGEASRRRQRPPSRSRWTSSPTDGAARRATRSSATPMMQRGTGSPARQSAAPPGQDLIGRAAFPRAHPVQPGRADPSGHQRGGPRVSLLRRKGRRDRGGACRRGADPAHRNCPARGIRRCRSRHGAAQADVVLDERDAEKPRSPPLKGEG